MSRRGAFITIEGGDGVGKSTQLNAICDYLNTQEIEFVTTREPGGTALAEHLRDLVLKPDTYVVNDAATEVMLMMTARMHHVNTYILPNLAKGIWVISDRFTDSTIAYQGYGSGYDIDEILKLADVVHAKHWPDLTLLLDAPCEVSAKRRQKRAEPDDRFEKEQEDFKNRVREGYLEVAKLNQERVIIIDAAQEIGVVTDHVIREITQFAKAWQAV